MSRLASFLAAIESRLALILVANGYNTNAGQRVFRARRTIAESDLPCVVLWAGTEAGPGANTARSYQNTTTFTVDGFVAANQANTGDQLELIRADIKKAIVAAGDLADPAGGSAGAMIGYGGSTPAERADGSTYEGVTCTFTLLYTEKKGDPNAA